MGENELSHPIGILSGFSDCRTPKSRRGRRSPLNSRFTENGDVRAAGPAPAVGSPKNGVRPTKTNASAVSPDALAIRIKSLAIGSLRRTDPIVAAIDHLNVRRRDAFRNRARGTNKRLGAYPGGRPSFFSPPPVLGRSKCWAQPICRSAALELLEPQSIQFETRWGLIRTR